MFKILFAKSKLKNFFLSLGYMGLSALTGAISSDLTYGLYEGANKPVKVSEIEKKYGLTVNGLIWSDPKTLDEVVEVCELQRGQTFPNIRKIHIEPTSPQDKTHLNTPKTRYLDKLLQFILGPYTSLRIGSTIHVVDHPDIAEDVFERVLLETNRSQTISVNEINKGFKERWLQSCGPLDNGSIYVSNEKWLLQQLFNPPPDMIEALKDNEKRRIRSDGFVDYGSRQDFLTDVARFCSKAEWFRGGGPSMFARLLKGNHHPRLREKLELAIEYGLIPSDSKEFFSVYENLLECFNVRREILLDLREEQRRRAPSVFQQAYITSKAFFENYPTSAFLQVLAKHWVVYLPRHVNQNSLGDIVLDSQADILPEEVKGKKLKDIMPPPFLEFYISPPFHEEKGEVLWKILSFDSLECFRGKQPSRMHFSVY